VAPPGAVRSSGGSMHTLRVLKRFLSVATLLAVAAVTHADDTPAGTSSVSDTVKHDAQTVGDAVKDGAQRVGTAAKGVATGVADAATQGAHGVADAAKSGAAKAKAAVTGDTAKPTANESTPKDTADKDKKPSP
jgi:hypothetical protein